MYCSLNNQVGGELWIYSINLVNTTVNAWSVGLKIKVDLVFLFFLSSFILQFNIQQGHEIKQMIDLLL